MSTAQQSWSAERYEEEAAKWRGIRRMRDSNPRKLFNNRECVNMERWCLEKAAALREAEKPA